MLFALGEKDDANVIEIDDLYNAANQAWDASSLLDLLNKNTIQSTGMHIQTGVQGKLLMLNVFANARYTFIIDE